MPNQHQMTQNLWVLSNLMQKHASGFKNAFSVPRACILEIFQNHTHIANLGRLSEECTAVSVLMPIAQSQKLPLIFGTHKMIIFRCSTLLGHVVNVNADVNHMLYFVLET